MSLETDIRAGLAAARKAARLMAQCSTAVKNQALLGLAQSLRERSDEIVAANARDLELARGGGLQGALLERLTLNSARVEAMAAGVEQIAALPDPVGEVIAGWRRPNGLEIRQLRVPIGSIAVIYESRPNVTVDAAALVLKAGNAVVLRGGKEALVTNRLLAELIGSAMAAADAPREALYFIDIPDHEGI